MRAAGIKFAWTRGQLLGALRVQEGIQVSIGRASRSNEVAGHCSQPQGNGLAYTAAPIRYRSFSYSGP